MAKTTKVFNKLKALFSGDDTSDFSEVEKAELNQMLKQRKMELVAQKKLRDLERKYAPKEKKSASDTFSKIKEYRQKNLARTQSRLNTNKQNKQKFKQIEMNRKTGRKMPKDDSLSNVGRRIKELEAERKRRMMNR